MKTIRISDEVWGEIAKHGKFGETEDDVLRRVFGISSKIEKVESVTMTTPSHLGSRRKSKIATDRLSADISGEEFVVEFMSGPSDRWVLPDRHDKLAISQVTHQAMAFAEKHGATDGQINYVRKALTDAGYHITK